MIPNSTGKKIYNLRKARGWTQSEVAEKLFVSDKTISRWESGLGYPEIGQLPQIAALFGVTIDYLLIHETQKDNLQEPFLTSDKTVISEPQVKTSPSQNLVSNETTKKTTITKAFNITLLTLSILVLISFFFKIIEVSATVPILDETISASFRMIDLLSSSSFLAILIGCLFLFTTIYEIINNLLVLTNKNIEESRYLSISKNTSLITSLLLMLASILFIATIVHFYSIILLIVSVLMFIVSIFHFKKITLTKKQLRFMSAVFIILASISFLALIFLTVLDDNASPENILYTISFCFIFLPHIYYTFKTIRLTYLTNLAIPFNILSILASVLLFLIIFVEIFVYKFDVTYFEIGTLLFPSIIMLGNIIFLLVTPKKS